MVQGNDLNALSVLEYAVTYLDVTDIIVTGHYDCGAIRAATSRQDLGTLEHWLRSIRDVYRLHRRDLDILEVSTRCVLPHLLQSAICVLTLSICRATKTGISRWSS